VADLQDLLDELDYHSGEEKDACARKEMARNNILKYIINTTFADMKYVSLYLETTSTKGYFLNRMAVMFELDKQVAESIEKAILKYKGRGDGTHFTIRLTDEVKKIFNLYLSKRDYNYNMIILPNKGGINYVIYIEANYISDLIYLVDVFSIKVNRVLFEPYNENIQLNEDIMGIFRLISKVDIKDAVYFKDSKWCDVFKPQ